MRLWGMSSTDSPGPAAPTPRRSLWRDLDFLKILMAQSTSNLGQMMMVVPLVTILIDEGFRESCCVDRGVNCQCRR